MNNIDVEKTLISLGYELEDRGTYWQSTALYRSGDNKTALQIYKDTGIWKDYVQGTSYMPFKKLVQVTLGTTDLNEIEKHISKGDSFDFEPPIKKQYIQMEKTYNTSCLSRLLPHYNFYKSRGISEDTLSLFQGGLCTEGKMYQRFVFPIYNLSNKIHGFSGRDMNESENRPKWKHIGTKSKWIYPFRLTLDEIKSKDELILVESIGDGLALYENGFKNFLCTFGVDISPSLISYMVSLNPSKIIISFNNDSSKPDNPGLNGAIKAFFKLISFFNYHKMNICLPIKNDFGDMNADDFIKWKKKKNKIKNQYDNIIDSADDMMKNSSQPDVFRKRVAKFKKEFKNHE
jgi:hypothetical protein